VKTLFAACSIVALAACITRAEEERHADVVVNVENDEGEHDEFLEMGEYGQPAWAERNRAGSTTKAYVLSPYEAFAGIDWEADFVSHGKFRSELSQEVELGLPHRIELGIENNLGFFGSTGHESAFSFEGRYAFADWDKIPFNPAVSLGYVVGLGDNVQSDHRNKGRTILRDQPDAVVMRILLARSFAQNRLGYAINFGLEQEVAGRSGRQFQIDQSASYALSKGAVELGAEMRYAHSTSQSVLGHNDEFGLGPLVSWKPWRQARISLTTFFGCGSDSPPVTAVLLVSYEFGGAEAIMPPASTRDR
jgi:hypothetical protein